MTTEIKLKNFILAKYKSIREFCIKNGFPYSTIDNMLKRERGVMGTSVSVILKVCKCLNIDADALAAGEIVEKVPLVIELSDNEKRLILAYREKTEMQSAVNKILEIK